MLRGLVPGSGFRGKFRKEEENVSKLLDNKFLPHFRKKFVWGGGQVTSFSFATILPPEPNMCLFEEGQR